MPVALKLRTDRADRRDPGVRKNMGGKPQRRTDYGLTRAGPAEKGGPERAVYGNAPLPHHQLPAGAVQRLQSRLPVLCPPEDEAEGGEDVRGDGGERPAAGL